VGKYRNNPQFRKMFEAGDRVFGRLGLGDADTLNPVMVSYYEAIGYLPQGILNALARLGWSLDDKTEYISRETLISSFTLDRVIKSPAGFDPDKLQSYQAHWMGQLPREEKITRCLPFLIQAKLIAENPDAETQEYVGKVIDALGERLVIFGDILNAEDFFLPDDQLAYDEKAFEKRISNAPEAVRHLKAFREKLADAKAFDAASLEALLKDYCEAAGIKLGDVIHALRVAATGKAQGPGLFDCLAVLGRERCSARIDHAVSRAGS
jgi:glutamyl-tRNA synthetase